MADLIDRDRLLKYIDGMSIEDTSNNLVFKTANTVLSMFKQVIEAIPKADTERHAHWIKEKVEDITYPWYRRVCSNCKMQSPLGREHNYCPHCGCKMDEVEE